MPELIPAEPGSPDWLAARRAGVTATDIVTILGLSRYDSQYSLYWRKLGQVPEVEDSDRFRLSRALERYIVERFEEVYDGLAWNGGLFRNSDRPWQMATPDRTTGLIMPTKFTGVLEVKSWADADRHSWQDAPPAQVRAQVLWQMDVMDVAVGHVGVVFLPSGEFRSYTIDHTAGTFNHDSDPARQRVCEICQDLELMRAAGEEFMGRLRLELPPPDPDSSAATLAAVRARFAHQPDKTAEIDRGLWMDYQASKQGIESHEKFARLFESQIREQAGEASVYTVDGQPVARRIITDAQVKAHVRHQDYIRRINQGDDNDSA